MAPTQQCIMNIYIYDAMQPRNEKNLKIVSLNMHEAAHISGNYVRKKATRIMEDE